MNEPREAELDGVDALDRDAQPRRPPPLLWPYDFPSYAGPAGPEDDDTPRRPTRLA